jgi:deoxyribodipyrimidine photo-lyase
MVAPQRTALVWFRRDLRLQDNPALAAALRAHARVVCCYVHAPEEEAPWSPGAASRWWLHHALAALDLDLRERGARLHLLRGPTLQAIDILLESSGADAVYWNRCYEPALRARDATIEVALRERGVDTHAFNATLLVEPDQIATAQGGPYKVFTPFWRKLRTLVAPVPPMAAPKRVPAAEVRGGMALDDLQLLPCVAWDAGLRASWQPGEAGAQERLAEFVADALPVYRDGRDRPGIDATSRLSPHLHFGEIGPRQITWALEAHARGHADGAARAGSEAFLREIGWRDFSYHLLHHFPRTSRRNLNRQFDAFPWGADDAQALGRWQRGRTGIPIVDAGMRQLWHSGWMHNRVRMLVASFLTKNLRQHWLHGARWFWDTLVDADLANNTQGWQWTAGTGADAAPYFRIFNPVTQGERFDADGSYVRRWVPELRELPAPLIHRPWQDADALRRTGYPAPMIDLGESRRLALAAYQSMRAAGT